MDIALEDVGKRYNRTWIFSKVQHHFTSGTSYAILGNNGSGKSTLLQVVSGFLSPTEGKVIYREANQEVPASDFYQHFSWVAPYVEVPEEFSFRELLEFHFSFKPLLKGMGLREIPAVAGLTAAANQPLTEYSSGMKQRVRLCLALFSDVPVLLLDEPTTHLDRAGISWYREVVQEYATNRLLIISSNQEHEFDFCQQQLQVGRWKPEKR